MRVLVTGGAGFIGSHLVDKLVLDGHTVLTIDDLSTGKKTNLNKDADFVQMDICDSSLSDLVSSFKPEIVSHCAAHASVRDSVKNPARDALVNIVGGINLCKSISTTNPTQLIYITTGGALYGNPNYIPCDETHPVRPISPYGLSKWVLEQYLHMLMPERIHLKVLRLANVYGPRQDPDGEAGVVSIFGKQMMKSNKIEIFGDGEQTRDYVFVSDVIDAHVSAQSVDSSFTLNIGSGVELSVNSLFREMADISGYILQPLHVKDREGDVKQIALESSLAFEKLSWKPKTSIRQGIKHTLEWIAGQYGHGL